MSTAYGVTPITAGSDTRVTVTNINISCVIVANESPYSLLCKIDGTGSGKWVHALTIDRIDVPSMGFTGNLIFTPTTVLSNTANAPSYAMIVETYGVNEEPPGVYPVSLTRSVNVGNAVTTNVTNSTLIFDGAVAGTQFIESKPSGDTNSTVTLDNSANLVLGDAAHAGSLTLQGPASISGQVDLFSAGGLISHGGDIQSYNGHGIQTTSGNITSGGDIVGSGNLKLINAITGTDAVSWAAVTPGSTTRIAAPTTVALQVPGGSTILSAISSGVNVSGNLAASGSITGQGFVLTGATNYGLYTNSLSRWSDFSGTGSVTVNHSLGATPSFAWCWCDAAASSQTMGNTQTSTQVTVTAGAGLHWHGCAVRY